MNELALFAGIGGGILGGKLLGWRTMCAVEIDPFCREVLLRRQLDGCIPRFPIWDDAKTFDGKRWRGYVDIVTAGFPCQPFSVAGKRLAENDKRNMWPETARIISEVEPRYVLLENVPGIRKYLPVVIRDLRRLGYRVARPTVIAAASMGAGHIRKRVWVFAYLQSIGHDARGKTDRIINTTLRPSAWWAVEPGVDRVVYGVPHRVDRVGALGNAQVPVVATTALELLVHD